LWTPDNIAGIFRGAHADYAGQVQAKQDAGAAPLLEAFLRHSQHVGRADPRHAAGAPAAPADDSTSPALSPLVAAAGVAHVALMRRSTRTC